VGWGIGGSLMGLLATERRGEVQDHLRLHQFLRTVVVVLFVDVIIWICICCGSHLLFVYVCSTGIFGAIHRCLEHHCMRMYKRGGSGVFSAGLWLALISSVGGSFGRGKCLPIFNRGLMCTCCACVCTHTHAHCMWGTRM